MAIKKTTFRGDPKPLTDMPFGFVLSNGTYTWEHDLGGGEPLPVAYTEPPTARALRMMAGGSSELTPAQHQAMVNAAWGLGASLASGDSVQFISRGADLQKHAVVDIGTARQFAREVLALCDLADKAREAARQHRAADEAVAGVQREIDDGLEEEPPADQAPAEETEEDEDIEPDA